VPTVFQTLLGTATHTLLKAAALQGRMYGGTGTYDTAADCAELLCQHELGWLVTYTSTFPSPPSPAGCVSPGQGLDAGAGRLKWQQPQA
jgi:hypothetical protein